MMRTTYHRRVFESRRRAAALARRCPRCRAIAGAPCWARAAAGTVGYLHDERYEAAGR